MRGSEEGVMKKRQKKDYRKFKSICFYEIWIYNLILVEQKNGLYHIIQAGEEGQELK